MPPKSDPAYRGLGRGLFRLPPDHSLLKTPSPMEKSFVSAQKPEAALPEPKSSSPDESKVSLNMIV